MHIDVTFEVTRKFTSFVDMQCFKALRFLFVIAALLFVAKPFIGFSAYGQLKTAHHHLMTVKAFTKRKPECFEEAEQFKSAVQHALINPPVKTTLTIGFLLSILCPLIYLIQYLTGKRFYDDAAPLFTAGQKTYLLTGKLTI